MGRDGEEKKRVRNGLSSFGIARVPCGEIEITKERSRNAEERRRRRPRRARRLCRSTCFERKIEKGAKGENFPLSPKVRMIRLTFVMKEFDRHCQLYSLRGSLFKDKHC